MSNQNVTLQYLCALLNCQTYCHYLTLSLATGNRFPMHMLVVYRLHMVRHKPATTFPSHARLVFVVNKYI